MSESVLVYRREEPPEGSARAVVVALHGYRGVLEQLLPLARTIGPGFRLYAPEAPRPAQFMRDVPSQVIIDGGKTWYLWSGIDHIEPATFGDSLAQLELFVRDIHAEAEADQLLPIFLLGYDQGAVLAVSLAAMVPELVAGVIAVDGYLPSISALSEGIDRADGLTALLIHDAARAELPEAHVRATADRLAAAGATVTLETLNGASRFPARLSQFIAGWPAAQAAMTRV
jgi:predicted esterase